MNEVQFRNNGDGEGTFYIMDGKEQLGEMEVGTSDAVLTVYHTEVSEKAEGKGFAKKLLAAMVDHARKEQLQVEPLCAFVYAQFKRHPEEYNDVWKKEAE